MSNTCDTSLSHAVYETGMSPSGVEETGDASLSQNLLHHLEKHNQFDTFEYAATTKENHQKVVGAVKSLGAVEGVCIILVHSLF